MKSLKSKLFRGRIILIGTFVFLSIFPGEYYVRWLSVVFLAFLLGVTLVGYDVKMPYRRSASDVEYIGRRPEFERALSMVKRARKGGSRKLIEGELLEIHYILTGRNFQELRSNPPPALKAFYSSPDPYEGLKRALKILEAELNEDRGSSREV